MVQKHSAFDPKIKIHKQPEPDPFLTFVTQAGVGLAAGVLAAGAAGLTVATLGIAPAAAVFVAPLIASVVNTGVQKGLEALVNETVFHGENVLDTPIWQSALQGAVMLPSSSIVQGVKAAVGGGRLARLATETLTSSVLGTGTTVVTSFIDSGLNHRDFSIDASSLAQNFAVNLLADGAFTVGGSLAHGLKTGLGTLLAPHLQPAGGVPFAMMSTDTPQLPPLSRMSVEGGVASSSGEALTHEAMFASLARINGGVKEALDIPPHIRAGVEAAVEIDLMRLSGQAASRLSGSNVTARGFGDVLSTFRDRGDSLETALKRLQTTPATSTRYTRHPNDPSTLDVINSRQELSETLFIHGTRLDDPSSEGRIGQALANYYKALLKVPDRTLTQDEILAVMAHDTRNALAAYPLILKDLRQAASAAYGLRDGDLDAPDFTRLFEEAALHQFEFKSWAFDQDGNPLYKFPHIGTYQTHAEKVAARFLEEEQFRNLMPNGWYVDANRQQHVGLRASDALSVMRRAAAAQPLIINRQSSHVHAATAQALFAEIKALMRPHGIHDPEFLDFVHKSHAGKGVDSVTIDTLIAFALEHPDNVFLRTARARAGEMIEGNRNGAFQEVWPAHVDILDTGLNMRAATRGQLTDLLQSESATPENFNAMTFLALWLADPGQPDYAKWPVFSALYEYFPDDIHGAPAALAQILDGPSGPLLKTISHAKGGPLMVGEDEALQPQTVANLFETMSYRHGPDASERIADAQAAYIDGWLRQNGQDRSEESVRQALQEPAWDMHMMFASSDSAKTGGYETRMAVQRAMHLSEIEAAARGAKLHTTIGSGEAAARSSEAMHRLITEQGPGRTMPAHEIALRVALLNARDTFADMGIHSGAAPTNAFPPAANMDNVLGFPMTYSDREAVIAAGLAAQQRYRGFIDESFYESYLKVIQPHGLAVANLGAMSPRPAQRPGGKQTLFEGTRAIGLNMANIVMGTPSLHFMTDTAHTLLLKMNAGDSLPPVGQALSPSHMQAFLPALASAYKGQDAHVQNVINTAVHGLRAFHPDLYWQNMSTCLSRYGVSVERLVDTTGTHIKIDYGFSSKTYSLEQLATATDSSGPVYQQVVELAGGETAAAKAIVFAAASDMASSNMLRLINSLFYYMSNGRTPPYSQQHLENYKVMLDNYEQATGGAGAAQSRLYHQLGRQMLEQGLTLKDRIADGAQIPRLGLVPSHRSPQMQHLFEEAYYTLAVPLHLMEETGINEGLLPQPH